MHVGELKQLTLVVRNEGNVLSDPVVFVDSITSKWRVVGASATKGLPSYEPGEVSISLGRLQPGEQIVLVIHIRAPATSDSVHAAHCMRLISTHASVEEHCVALPQVLVVDDFDNTIVSQKSPTGTQEGSMPVLTILDDTAGLRLPGHGGATLVVRNTGSQAANGTYLDIQMMDSSLRVSDILTSLGLVSSVSQHAVVQIGRLDPTTMVAVNLRGWTTLDTTPTICTTLMADSMLQQQQCSELSIVQEETPLKTAENIP